MFVVVGGPELSLMKSVSIGDIFNLISSMYPIPNFVLRC